MAVGRKVPDVVPVGVGALAGRAGGVLLPARRGHA